MSLHPDSTSSTIPTSTDNVNRPRGTELRSDYLDEDPPIRGQKYVLFSFVSPDEVIKKRDAFMFEQFVKQWDFTESMQKFDLFLQFLQVKYGLDEDSIRSDFTSFVTSKAAEFQQDDAVSNAYKTFVDVNGDVLEKKFNEAVRFKTNVRGIIFRGAFATEEDAKERCRMLTDMGDTFDIFTTEMGKWVPMEPDAYKTGNVEYSIPDLNRLMHERAQNVESERRTFDARVQNSRKEIMDENASRSEKSGNKLTQKLVDGKLVKVTPYNVGEGEDATEVVDTFNPDDAVIDKTDPMRTKMAEMNAE